MEEMLMVTKLIHTIKMTQILIKTDANNMFFRCANQPNVNKQIGHASFGFYLNN